ncbi:MAG: hypothetical protein AAGG68_25710 [Bacteroidota bacterium]
MRLGLHSTDNQEATPWSMSKYWNFLGSNYQKLVLLGIPLLYLLTSVFFILYNSNWTFGDDAIFLETLAVGKPIQSFYSPDSGRFFPLAFLEYNPLGFDAHPARYYLWQAFKFSGLVIFFWYFLNTIIQGCFPTLPLLLRNTVLSLAICFLISAKSIFLIYANLIYSESSILILLTLFLIFYFKAILGNKRKTLHLLIAFAFANLSFYFKEPVLGAVLATICVPLLFQSVRDKINVPLLLSLSFLSAVTYFSLYYSFVWSEHTDDFYNTDRVANYSVFLFFKTLAKNHPLLLFSFAFGLFRIIDIAYRSVLLKQKVSTNLILFDGLLHSGNLYVLAYCFLKLVEGYYFTISYIFILPSIVFYIFYYLKEVDLLSIQIVFKKARIVHLSVLSFPLIFLLFASTVFHTFTSYRNEIKTSIELRSKQFSGLKSILPDLKNDLYCLVPNEAILNDPFQKTLISYTYLTLTKDLEFLSGDSLDVKLYHPNQTGSTSNYVQQHFLEKDNRKVPSYSTIIANKDDAVGIVVVKGYIKFLPAFLKSYNYIDGANMFLPFDFYLPNSENSIYNLKEIQ